MGTFINRGNAGFQSFRNSEFVDKSMLISEINRTLFTESRFTCVSRCRRFGKSMAAKMLAAYYDRSCDSRELFSDLEIANDPSFEKHLNKYPVIYLDMTDYVTGSKKNVVSKIKKDLKADIIDAYPDVALKKNDDLMTVLYRIATSNGEKFIFIIDEWDAICREFPSDSPEMKRYVDWLRNMFKSLPSVDVFAGVYMTGILPIKKYNTQSALNNFIEYSVIDPRRMAGLFGFTKDEVKKLSEKFGMEFGELEKWYDGYCIGNEPSMFNPYSVMQALYSDWCTDYWGKTAAYDAIVPYMTMNFEGLKDDIIFMLSGGRCHVDPTGFQNDLSVVHSKDDALTVLIHLGYLSYDRSRGECFIPNREVAIEMENAVKRTDWSVVRSLQASESLLKDTLAGKEDAVARGIDLAHDENTSILSYNDENSLACVLCIAYYSAKDYYTIHREFPSGKGYADLVMIPKKGVDSPAMVIELKCDSTPDVAIDQIKSRNYSSKVSEYAGDILLVGINYDRKTKTHSCRIERV